jgi:hypothetical protein
VRPGCKSPDANPAERCWEINGDMFKTDELVAIDIHTHAEEPVAPILTTAMTIFRPP